LRGAAKGKSWLSGENIFKLAKANNSERRLGGGHKGPFNAAAEHKCRKQDIGSFSIKAASPTDPVTPPFFRISPIPSLGPVSMRNKLSAARTIKREQDPRNRGAAAKYKDETRYALITCRRIKSCAMR